MIPLYDINNLNMKDITALPDNSSKESNLVIATLLVICVIGMGFYLVNQENETPFYEYI